MSLAFKTKPKIEYTFAQQNIAATFNHKVKTGEVGIELEWEGDNLNELINETIQKSWMVHVDESLDTARGGLEFVLNRPLNRETAKGAVDTLFQRFNEVPSSRLRLSHRCSTHVHVNMLRKTVMQTVLFASLYYIVEDALFRVISPQRKGNRFCLALSDSETMANLIRADLQQGFFNQSTNRGQRYAALSWHALQKFGSFEFRMMQGCDNAQALKTWIDVLGELDDFVNNHPMLQPDDFLGQFSSGNFTEYLQLHMPRLWDYIRLVDGIDDLINLGVWRAQDLVYSVDWSASCKAPRQSDVAKTVAGNKISYGEATQVFFDGTVPVAPANNWGRGWGAPLQPMRPNSEVRRRAARLGLQSPPTGGLR